MVIFHSYVSLPEGNMYTVYRTVYPFHDTSPASPSLSLLSRRPALPRCRRASSKRPRACWIPAGQDERNTVIEKNLSKRGLVKFSVILILHLFVGEIAVLLMFSSPFSSASPSLPLKPPGLEAKMLKSPLSFCDFGFWT